MHHFTNPGLYDGLFVMRDTETGTLWNHITGEALYGELVGRRLPISNLLQMNVRQALEMNPDLPVAISDREIRGLNAMRGPDAELSPMFVQTLGTEDERRPRMEMGLGIWSEDGAARRYYPVPVIRENDGAIIDEIGGREVLVYLEPLTSTPAALFVADASSAEWDGRSLRLDNGQIVRAGHLLNAAEEPQPAERPLQIFTRWYGYAFTFPGAEIYGE
jgi:hypothetical protein